MNKNKLKKLSNALYYQLNERVSFVKPKEKIVAQLLFDLGNVAFLLGNFHDAVTNYELAKQYGFSDQLIEARIKETNRLYKLPAKDAKRVIKTRVKPDYTIIAIVTIAVLLILLIILRIKKPKG